MELRDVYALVKVAEFRNFHRAALDLDVDASTLSRRVQRIEQELGLAIFNRDHRSVTFTSGGQELLRSARKIVQEVATMRESARSAGRAQVGRLRLATQLGAVGTNFRTALRSYRLNHPNISLQLAECSDKEVLNGLRDQVYDAGILLAFSAARDIEALELWRERLMLAAPERHSLAARKTVSWRDLRQESVIVQGWPDSDAFRTIETAFLGAGVSYKVHYASFTGLLGLVALGDGVMISPESYREYQIPGVRWLEIDETDAYVSISLAWLPSLEEAVAGSFIAEMRDLSALGRGAASQRPGRSS